MSLVSLSGASIKLRYGPLQDDYVRVCLVAEGDKHLDTGLEE